LLDEFPGHETAISGLIDGISGPAWAARSRGRISCRAIQARLRGSDARDGGYGKTCVPC
jgi:hypothetical protein